MGPEVVAVAALRRDGVGGAGDAGRGGQQYGGKGNGEDSHIPLFSFDSQVKPWSSLVRMMLFRGKHGLYRDPYHMFRTGVSDGSPNAAGATGFGSAGPRAREDLAGAQPGAHPLDRALEPGTVCVDERQCFACHRIVDGQFVDRPPGGRERGDDATGEYSPARPSWPGAPR
ncbi:hypothetical protein GCM10023192_42160 [Amycolatopsis samaneae]